jgi:hypothetical protein
MNPFSVVKDLNPFGNYGSGNGLSLKELAMNQFGFQGAKKAFGD